MCLSECLRMCLSLCVSVAGWEWDCVTVSECDSAWVSLSLWVWFGIYCEWVILWLCVYVFSLSRWLCLRDYVWLCVSVCVCVCLWVFVCVCVCECVPVWHIVRYVDKADTEVFSSQRRRLTGLRRTAKREEKRREKSFEDSSERIDRRKRYEPSFNTKYNIHQE